MSRPLQITPEVLVASRSSRNRNSPTCFLNGRNGMNLMSDVERGSNVQTQLRTKRTTSRRQASDLEHPEVIVPGALTPQVLALGLGQQALALEESGGCRRVIPHQITDVTRNWRELRSMRSLIAPCLPNPHVGPWDPPRFLPHFTQMSGPSRLRTTASPKFARARKASWH